MAINLSNISQYFQYPSKVAELRERLYNILKNKGIEVTASESLNSLIEKVREVEPALEPQTIYLTQNNTSYDVTEYTEAIVDVPPVTVENDLDGLIDGSLSSFTMPSNISTLASARFSNFTNLSTVVMPQVKDIPDNTFEKCLTLQEITLPNVDTIGNYAFKDCYNLSNIIANNVKHIGQMAFQNCTKLESFDASMVNTLYSSTFQNCINLSTVSLPSLKYMSGYVFWNCFNLNNLNLPQLTVLTNNYFSNLNKLSYINFSNILKLSGFTFPRGVLNTEFNWNKLSYLYFGKASSSICMNEFNNLTTLNLGNVQYISGSSYDYLIGNCDNLMEIKFPNLVSWTYLKLAKNIPNLKTIDLGSIANLNTTNANSTSYVIQSCSNLESISMDFLKETPSYFMSNNKITSINCSNLVSIGSFAFTNLSLLTKVDAPNVRYVYSNAFNNCINLSDINFEHLHHIGKEAFKNCNNLSKSIYMDYPQIEDYAFDGCYNLTDIYLNTYTSDISGIDWNAFSNCGINGLSGNIYVPASLLSNYISFYSLYPFVDKFKSMSSEYENDKVLAYKYYNQPWTMSSIPDEEVNKSIIYNCAFYNTLNNVSNLTLPNVEYIGVGAFTSFGNGGNSSVSVVLPECKVINNLAFSSAYGGYYSLPKVEYIGDYGFYSLSRYSTRIYMPNIKYIGNGAFSYAANLTLLNSEFPNLEYIGSHAFSGTRSLILSNSNILSMPKLKFIGNYGFANMANWGTSVSLYLPELEYIGTSAFYNWASLKSVTLSKVKTIKAGAFTYCYSLTDVDSLYTCEHIEDYAFSYCSNLRLSLSSPNLLSIGYAAFSNCRSLKYVSAPELVLLGAYAFADCFNLSEFYAPKLGSLDGCTFQNCSNLSSITLDFDAIKSLNQNVFYSCGKLSQLEFKYVSQIGTYAFYNCSGLSKLVLNSNYSIVNDHTFYNCYNLDFSDIKLDNIVSIVGTGNFFGCSKLKSINNSYIYELNTETFGYCKTLEYINLPNLCSLVGTGTFAGCNNLSYFNINFSAITFLPTNTFYNCNKIDSLYFPNLNSLGNNVFCSCYNLHSFDLVNVTEILSSTFSDCINLSSINLSKVTRIGNAAFKNCRNLSTVDLNSIEYIDGNAFDGCSNLNINLPNLSKVWGWTYRSTAISIIDNSYIDQIAHSAFENCSNLQSVNLPNVTSISDNTFNGCINLSSINIPNISDLGVSVFARTALSKIPDGIDSNLSNIPNYLFYSCSNLSEVILSNCSKIGKNAFDSCINNSIINLQNIKRLEDIGTNAFDRNTNVSVLSLPEIENLRSIWMSNNYNNIMQEDNYPVFSCGNLEVLYAPKCSNFNSSTFYNYINKVKIVDLRNCWSMYGNLFTYNSNLESIDIRNMSYTQGYSSCYNLKNINIANTLRLDNYAFTNCSSLSEIIAPKANFIGYQTFMNCSNLVNISANYVSYISASAFANCSALIRLNINVIESVSTYAFYRCYNLRSIALTSARDAFNYCSNLESLYILNTNSDAYNILYSVNQFLSTPMMDSSYLGYYGSIYVPSSVISYYREDTRLVSLSSRFVELPSSIANKYILAYQFSNKSISIADINFNTSYILSNAFNTTKFIDFSSLTLPNIKYIGYMGFSSCQSLTEIILDNCNYLGSYAFYNCSNLSNVYIPNVYDIGSYAFAGCQNLTTLSLPNVEYVNRLFNDNNISLSELYFNKAKLINDLTGVNNLEKIDAPEAIYWKGPQTAKLKYINLPKLSYLMTYVDSTMSYSGNLGQPQISSYIEYMNLGMSSIYCYNNNNILANRSYGSIIMSNLLSLPSNLFSNASINYIDLPKVNYIGSRAFENTVINSINIPNVQYIYSYAFRSATVNGPISFNNVYALSSQAFYNFKYNYGSILRFPNLRTLSSSAFTNMSLETLIFDKPIYLDYSYLLTGTSVVNMVFNSGLSWINFSYYPMQSNTKLERVVIKGSIINYNYSSYNNRLFIYTPISQSSYLGYYGSIYVQASYLKYYKSLLSYYSSRITTIEAHETELRELGLID